MALVCCARDCATRRAAASAVCRAQSIVARTEATWARAASAASRPLSNSEAGDERLLIELALSDQLLISVAGARFGGGEIGSGTADLLGGAALFRLERPHQRGGARGVALRLHRVDPREHLPGLHPIAFGDRQADDLAHHAGADVGVPHGDDLTGRRDGGSESSLACDGAHIHGDASRPATCDNQHGTAERHPRQHDDQPPISSHTKCSRVTGADFSALTPTAYRDGSTAVNQLSWTND